jgi:hypothetical protein
VVYDNAGVLRADDGSELARAEALPAPALARVVVGAERFGIEKPSALGWHFQLLDAGGGVVYDFKPGLRKGGTVRSGDGAEVAHLLKALVGTGWTLTPAHGEQIEIKRREGLVGALVADDGRIVGPDLDISIPGGAAVGHDLARLLAFCGWLIEEWDA